MLSPGGIDTPFNYGKWNSDRKGKSTLPETEQEKPKKKRHQEQEQGESSGVIGNLAHLLSNVAQEDAAVGSTHTNIEK